jgi:hypothetical protein
MVAYRLQSRAGQHVSDQTIRAPDDLAAARLAFEQKPESCFLWRGQHLVAELQDDHWQLFRGVLEGVPQRLSDGSSSGDRHDAQRAS